MRREQDGRWDVDEMQSSEEGSFDSLEEARAYFDAFDLAGYVRDEGKASFATSKARQEWGARLVLDEEEHDEDGEFIGGGEILDARECTYGEVE